MKRRYIDEDEDRPARRRPRPMPKEPGFFAKYWIPIVIFSAAILISLAGGMNNILRSNRENIESKVPEPRRAFSYRVVGLTEKEVKEQFGPPDSNYQQLFGEDVWVYYGREWTWNPVTEKPDSSVSIWMHQGKCIKVTYD